MPRVLMIVGSLREQSFNRQLAREVIRIIGNRAEVEELDWHDVPLMNQDIEWPTPEAVQRARDAVTQADVLWFCSPEYNYQIPGGLKNLLDWLSRPTDEHDRTSPSAIRGKHAVICGAAGKSAAAGMRKQLQTLLGILGVEVLGGDGLGISLTPESWQTDILTLEPGTQGMLGALVDDTLRKLNP